MEGKHTRTALPAPGSIGPRAKNPQPQKVKKTVSAAAVFKQQHRKAFKNNVKTPTTLNNSKFIAEDADASTLLSVQSHSSARNTKRSGSRIQKKSSETHPLAVAFKDTSASYRQHLYQNASLQINKTLETLLTNLYDGTLQTIPNQQTPTTSPLKLSASAKYNRLAAQLSLPISQFRLTLRRTDSEGKEVRFEQTLETRMLHYEEYIAKQREEIASLHKKWEDTVCEIWKLGVRYLGEGVMQDILLLPKKRSDTSSSSSSFSPDDESTLFIREHNAHTNKKHVDLVETRREMTKKGPDFLYQNRKTVKVPMVPALSGKHVEEIEESVQELGQREIEEFHQIEREHHAYWKRKTRQMAVALKSDD